MRVDLGDVVAELSLRVKGRTRRRVRITVGAPYPTSPEDRVVKGPPYHRPDPSAEPTERITFAMDLQADKQVPLSLEWTDEVGNPVATPAGATSIYTVDDPTIINLTDHGDGTAVAAAVGTPGQATVHVEATGDGTTVTGDLQIVVVAGLAERVNVVAGEPEEITPDT